MPEKLKKGWRARRFDQMAVMVNDRIDDPSEADVEYYVGLEHLDSDSLTIRRWGTPSDVEATKLRFRAGDIIFGRRRVYQRKVGRRATSTASAQRTQWCFVPRRTSYCRSSFRSSCRAIFSWSERRKSRSDRFRRQSTGRRLPRRSSPCRHWRNNGGIAEVFASVQNLDSRPHCTA